MARRFDSHVLMGSSVGPASRRLWAPWEATKLSSDSRLLPAARKGGGTKCRARRLHFMKAAGHAGDGAGREADVGLHWREEEEVDLRAISLEVATNILEMRKGRGARGGGRGQSPETGGSGASKCKSSRQVSKRGVSGKPGRQRILRRGWSVR